MSKTEQQYLALQQDILDNGKLVGDRTGTGCYRVFSRSLRFDLSEGFPLLTTKKIFWKNIIGELLWFLSGNTDLDSLCHYQNKPKGSHTIWTDDFNNYWDRIEKYEKEKLEQPKITLCLERSQKCGGGIYGAQLRRNLGYTWEPVDQFTLLINNIKAVKEDPNHPMGRRLKCEFWNPEDHLDPEGVSCALPACHTGFQCMVDDGKLNLKFNMRSNDVFLGLPYNIASYAVLTHILAHLTGLEVGEMVYDGTDVHLYSNHIEQVKEQLTRTPRELPTLVLPKFNTLEELLEYTAEDFDVVGYNPHPFIKAPQAS